MIDGFDHMQAEVVPEEPADEEDSEKEDAKVEIVEAPKPKEKPREEAPEIYNCPVCTLENPVSVASCDACGTPRPPMEVIIAEFRAAQAAL